NPGLYSTFSVRLKRDDGAVVYVNGIPVVRDNMPAGTLTASTPASSFTSGAAESTWYDYQVPASLFAAGDNTIAVEVHQAHRDNELHRHRPLAEHRVRVLGDGDRQLGQRVGAGVRQREHRREPGARAVRRRLVVQRHDHRSRYRLA